MLKSVSLHSVPGIFLVEHAKVIIHQDSYDVQTKKARAAIFKDLRSVIEFDRSKVDYCHLALLCDLKRDDCHGVSENIIFGQMAPMGTGSFDVAVDINMLKDAIVDHRLPTHKMLSVPADGGMMPGQGVMTPYDADSPMWEGGMFKGESAAFSPLAGNGREDPGTFQWSVFSQSPIGAGGIPAGSMYSPSSPNAYSPTSPVYVPQSPFGGATSPTSPYATSPFYDHGCGPTSPTYSPTSPVLNLTSPGYSPMSPHYSPPSPSFSLTSPFTTLPCATSSPTDSLMSPAYSATSPCHFPNSTSFFSSFGLASPRCRFLEYTVFYHLANDLFLV